MSSYKKKKFEEKRDDERTFYVSGKAAVRTTYLYQNRKDGKKSETFTDLLPFSETVKATSKEDAEAQVREKLAEQIEKDHEDSQEVVERSLKDVDFITREPPKTQATEDMPMKAADYVDYEFIPQDTKHFKHEGFCVVDVLLGVYAKLPRNKKLTREWIMEQCKSNNQVYFEDDSDEARRMCELETDWVKNKDNWIWVEVDDDFSDTGKSKALRLKKPPQAAQGITPRMVHKICVELDISHYAFDLTNKCFLKHVCQNKKNNHGPALVYYAIDNHMYYLDRDAKDEQGNNIVRSLINEAVAIESKHQSLLVKGEPARNIYNEREIKENIPVSELKQHKDCIIIYDLISLDDILDEIILTYRYVPTKLKYNELNCVQMKFKGNVVLVVDPNHEHKGKTDMNWQQVRQWCEHFKVEFTNQSFSTVMQELKEEHFRPARYSYNKEEREMFLKENPTCSICQKQLTMKTMHIDHIVPLAAGGDNEPDNLQALCKPCHFSKTKEEQDNHEYIRISPTQSTFNDRVKEIINSENGKVFAFIETLSQCKEEQKVYTFDINKCRTNQLYYSEYDYPLFTVMDEPKVYKQGSKKKPAMYYVESGQYVPMRCNGWYRQPMIEYCLTLGLIQESDIKFVVEASLSVPRDYFKGFIDMLYQNLPEKLAKFAVNSMIGCFKLKDKDIWDTQSHLQPISTTCSISS
jgi:5-methylcytosine-specific restriction endonuclease McrA